VQIGSINMRSGKFLSHRSAPRIWSTDFLTARRYQRDHLSAMSPVSGQLIDLSLKMITSSPHTASRSHSSLPSPPRIIFLSVNVFGYDQRSRNVDSARRARYCSDSVTPAPRRIGSLSLPDKRSFQYCDCEIPRNQRIGWRQGIPIPTTQPAAAARPWRHSAAPLPSWPAM